MQQETRPWGSFQVLADEPNYKVKRIIVLPNRRLSLQLHHQRSEHWFFVSGTGHVTIDDTIFAKEAGQSIDIPVKTKHRVANRSDQDLVFIEIQTGSYFGEDDIERFEDDFGRVS